MSKKSLPFTKEKIEQIAESYRTPFHIYDEAAIRDKARTMNDAFSWIHEFKNYFAVKACPNPVIMNILKEEGFGADCSSEPELVLSDAIGLSGEEIMFTSNDTPEEEFIKAENLGAIINLDDIGHIKTLEQSSGIPELICFRYNPGKARTGNVIIGEPTEAKYGLTSEQIMEGYRIMKEKGVKRFGLHTMVASNELDGTYFVETARMLFELAVRLKNELDITLDFINMGGGIGIPYKLEDEPVDLYAVSKGMKEIYDELIVPAGLDPLKIVFECGRMITGPYGYLVSRVRHVAKKYKDYVGLDSSMANLMRPALYGAYHHISVLGKEEAPLDHTYDVTGSLCENNDKFAIDRKLPEVAEGDLLAIYDAGAHGYSMGFNYNGKLRSAELLLKTDGSIQLIRRAETMDDYFATLRFPEAEYKL
ncbi:MAG: diaminopimelate decarboxylase [Spirochaetia bacterium]|nr:diaminopimelate decarboxylase [Spirochaetia bacterium]MCF7953799.1 diaminopimelate decarboxylase [Spirochaetales bacterium]